MITRRRFLRNSAAAGLGLGAGLGFYTWRVEPHWVEFVERPLPIANLPRNLAGWRLVQLSDLHIGPRVDDAYLLRIFERVRRLAPEIVVFTGDFTTHHDDVLAHAGRIFAHLPRGTRGTYGILGNHDYGSGWSQVEQADRIARLATEVGVIILRNAMAEVEGLHVIGLDDLWADRFDPKTGFREVPSKGAAVALSHNPDTADLSVWGDYRGWILAGHTHGGQCRPPFLPPPILPVRNRRYTAGEYSVAGGRRLYINRGLGHLVQVRFNVRPEVTSFRLERA